MSEINIETKEKPTLILLPAEWFSLNRILDWFGEQETAGDCSEDNVDELF